MYMKNKRNKNFVTVLLQNNCKFLVKLLVQLYFLCYNTKVFIEK